MSTFWNLTLSLLLSGSWMMLHGTYTLQVLRGISLS